MFWDFLGVVPDCKALAALTPTSTSLLSPPALHCSALQQRNAPAFSRSNHICIMSSPPPPLPAGWSEVTASSGSPSHYSNSVTGHSQTERPVQQQRHRCFPDPDPMPLQEGPSADDVSGFNGQCLCNCMFCVCQFAVEPEPRHAQPLPSPASSCREARARSSLQASADCRNIILY